MTTRIDDIISYYTFQALVDQDKETISCVEILDIDTRMWEPLWENDKANIREIMEKLLRHFTKLREVRLSKWSWRRTYQDDATIVSLFHDTFRKIARETIGYSVPRVQIKRRRRRDH